MGGMMGGQAYPQQGMGMSMSRPGSRPPTRPGSAMGSPTPPVELAIPQTKRVAYSAQFQVSCFVRLLFIDQPSDLSFSTFDQFEGSGVLLQLVHL